MTRNEFCELIGMPANTFKALRRRGEVPFIQQTTEMTGSQSRKWSHYSVHEAAAMIAAMQLAHGQSLSWADASAIILGGQTSKRERIEGYGIGGVVMCGPAKHANLHEGNHVARVEYLNASNRVSNHRPQYVVYSGDLVDIVMTAKRDTESLNARRRLPHETVQIASMVSVDLSRAYHIARENMKRMGIEDDPEDFGMTEEAE